MAKSRDGMRPSFLTRRTVLASAVMTPLTPPSLSSGDWTSRAEPDPVLTLWQEWQQAQAEAEACRAKWQGLESTLFRTVGFPSVPVAAPDDGSIVHVIAHDDIEDLLGDAGETAALRARLHADLASHQARWNGAAASLQFDTAEAQYDAADARAAVLGETLLKTPAGTIAGIAAKLALVITIGEPSAHDQQFPWRHLREVLADLRRLAGRD